MINILGREQSEGEILRVRVVPCMHLVPTVLNKLKLYLRPKSGGKIVIS